MLSTVLMHACTGGCAFIDCVIFISGCALIIFIGNTRVFSQQLWLWEYLFSQQYVELLLYMLYVQYLCVHVQVVALL